VRRGSCPVQSFRGLGLIVVLSTVTVDFQGPLRKKDMEENLKEAPMLFTSIPLAIQVI
jgi:hypothetical protein